MSDQHTAAPGVEHAAHDEHHPYVNYWMIFVALCLLTGVSWLADKMGDWNLLHKGTLLTFIVLAVACAKAMFVMLYFMHLKFEGKWKFVLLAPTMVLAMAIPAALMPDIGSHYYDYEVPQLEPDEDAAIAAEGHGTPEEHGAPVAEHGAKKP
jgi:cytochrome c oxidase subunit 4